MNTVELLPAQLRVQNSMRVQVQAVSDRTGRVRTDGLRGNKSWPGR